MSALVVLWSDKAKKTYLDIIENLNIRWTEKETNHFISRTEAVINKIVDNPLLFQQYKNNPLIRQAVLHATTILIYKISADEKTIHPAYFLAGKA
jgi:plasmid stabilization system protein ParE